MKWPTSTDFIGQARHKAHGSARIDNYVLINYYSLRSFQR